MVSHLQHHTQATATIIDTAGTLSIPSLFNLILARLIRDKQAFAVSDNVDLEEYATGMLDRVRIMRVFDVEGMVEGIAELREELEGQHEDLDGHEIRNDIDTEVIKAGAALRIPGPRGTVADSQADADEEELVDEDEILMADESAVMAPLNDSIVTAPTTTTTTATEDGKQNHAGEESSFGLLIIVNLTEIFSPLLKNNHAQGTYLPPHSLRANTPVTPDLTLTP